MQGLWDLNTFEPRLDVVVPGDTIPAMFWNAVKQRGDTVWMRQKELGIWRSWSWHQTADAVREIAAGLQAIGLAPGECASILSNQNIELFEHATVLHNLLIGRHTHRQTGFWSEVFFTPATRRAEIAAREKAEQVIELLDLQHHRDSMVAGLPYGVRKVVELARALCTEPKLLLLDEPSSGLNVEETADMAFWIQDIQHELGVSVLMVEHDMSLVSKVSDRVLAMNMGEVLATGTPGEVQADPRVVEAYLGTVDDVSSLRRVAA